LFFADLLHLYTDLLPPLVERKKRESERVMPTRKRTAIVDQRISRTSLTDGANPQELLELQHAKQNPVREASPERVPSLPVAPTTEEQQDDSSRSETPDPAAAAEPTAQDKSLSSGATSLSRAGSAETSRLRGPRGRFFCFNLTLLPS
jgi:hypothetical protein